MWLHFDLMKARCLKASDHGAYAEFYFTYQLYLPGPERVLLHQGFSTGCPIDDGYRFDDEENRQRRLGDPKFTVELPAVDEGQEQLVVIDLQLWEADHASDTVSIKAAHTNDAAAKLWELYQASQRRKQATIDEALDWLDRDGREVADAALALLATAGVATSGAAPIVAGFIELGPMVLNLVSMLSRAMRDSRDDFIGQRRIELLLAKKEGKHVYRWLTDQGLSTTISEQTEPYYLDNVLFHQANLDNRMTCKIKLQPIYALSEL